jgi:hypothetical protein
MHTRQFLEEKQRSRVALTIKVLAADRLHALDGIPLLPPAPEIPQIAGEIMSRAILPPDAQVDALHIAAVSHHQIIPTDMELQAHC